MFVRHYGAHGGRYELEGRRLQTLYFVLVCDIRIHNCRDSDDDSRSKDEPECIRSSECAEEADDAGKLE